MSEKFASPQAGAFVLLTAEEWARLRHLLEVDQSPHVLANAVEAFFRERAGNAAPTPASALRPGGAGGSEVRLFVALNREMERRWEAGEITFASDGSAVFDLAAQVARLRADVAEALTEIADGIEKRCITLKPEVLRAIADRQAVPK